MIYENFRSTVIERHLEETGSNYAFGIHICWLEKFYFISCDTVMGVDNMAIVFFVLSSYCASNGVSHNGGGCQEGYSTFLNCFLIRWLSSICVLHFLMSLCKQ